MDIVLKKTTELSNSEIEQICSVFRDVFPEHDKTVTQFKNEFTNTEYSFSYHILLVEKGIVVGAQTFIPFSYFIHNDKFLFALSVDTMIKADYRNFDNIYDLWSTGRKAIKNEGVVFLFGFPNENAYPVLIKGIGDRDIGELQTYVLPYQIGTYFPKLKFLNFISQIFCKLLITFSYLSKSNKSHNFIIRKDRDNFNNYRYKWFDGDYNKVDKKNLSFVYKVIIYNGIRTAFLMDVYPMTKKNFDAAVRIMFSRSHSDFEVALYVGYLHFNPLSMIKIPNKYVPKKFHFVGKILDKGILDADLLFDINNWDINLSNYDLL